MIVTISIRSTDVDIPPLSLDSPRIVLGRSKSSDVRIPDVSVSSRHATIRQRGGEYLLMDEGSSNGTFVDGRRLSPGSPVILEHKSVVRLGRVWLDIALEPTVASSNPLQLTKEIALGLIAGALEAEGQPCAPRLLVRSGPAAGAELVLAEQKRVYVVGRGADADFDLLDEDTSRKHLEVTRRRSDVLLRDLGSKNGAWLDGQQLEARKPVLFQPGQVLRVASSTLELVDPLLETLSQLEAEPDEVMSEEEASRRANAKKEAAHEQQEDEGVVELKKSTNSVAPSRPVANARGGWTLTDVLVATLALVVLGVSIAGIVWLFSA
jgi:pSer/pThr/pTyr-binding forkhead associated (FHA) protein